MARKAGIGSLLLAGLAAYGIYRFTKMSPEQKRNLKDKGKKFIDENIPQNLKNVFNRSRHTDGVESNYTPV